MATALARHAGLLVGFLVIASTAWGQSGLSRAVQQLPFTPIVGGQRSTDSRLYESRVVATIIEDDQSDSTFLASERIAFEISPRAEAARAAAAARCPGGSDSLAFSGTRTDFEAWARRDEISTCLLAMLFPASLGASVLGRSPAELYGQQFLLTTVLATEDVRAAGPEAGRWTPGGLIEFESLRRTDRADGDSILAWQGAYALSRTVSVQGRFTRQRESISSNATSVSVDYHPYIELDRTVRVRIGGAARGGVLYSQAAAMDLGSLEFGGGGWVSLFKNLGRVRVGGGSMLQGSKSYVPTAFAGDDDDIGFLADAINNRGIQYDLSYGGTAGIDTSSKTAVIVKFLETRALSTRDQRPDSWLLMTGLSYRFGLPSLNFGYKLYSTDALRGHSVFLQGNFNW
jgi:hypothetical protein